MDDDELFYLSMGLMSRVLTWRAVQSLQWESWWIAMGMAFLLWYNASRLALECWSTALAGRFLLVFVDNDGARHSWIRGTADSRFARKMIHEGTTLLESKIRVSSYFCRVPTASNIGDGPSRLDFTLCDRIGCKRTFLTTEMLCRCAAS